MIKKAAIYTCDICKTKEIISTESGTSDGWADFFIGDVGLLRIKNVEPSQLCPACARKIKLVVAEMVNDSKKELEGMK